MAGAGRPEGTAWHDRHPFLQEQALRKDLVAQAGRGHPWEGVERATRLERLEPDGVQAIDDESPPPVVLGQHPLDIRLALENRGERRVLADRRGRHDPVLVDLDQPFQDAGRCGHVAHAPAGHGVGL